MENCHKSEQLEVLIGCNVKITFFNDNIKIGILQHSQLGKKYMIDNLMFRKSYVKEVAKV